MQFDEIKTLTEQDTITFLNLGTRYFSLSIVEQIIELKTILANPKGGYYPWVIQNLLDNLVKRSPEYAI